MDSPQHQSPRKKASKQFNSYVKYSGLAFQMMVTCGLATWLGYWIDQSLGLKFPAFMVGLLICSLVGVIYWLVLSVIKDSGDEKKP